MKKGKFTILEVNILYFAMALLLVFLGAYVQSLNIKSGLLITEYILVLLPVVIILKLKHINLKSFLRLNKLKLKHGSIIVLATLCIYPVAMFFNLIMLTILSCFGLNIEPVPIPTADSLIQYIVLFFIIAVSAGICEEVFFRGLLLRVYEKKSKMSGLVITAILFGLFHFNLQNLIGPIVLGLVFGYLVQITDSIYAGIIGHITNNGFAVTLMYVSNVLQGRLSEYGDMPVDSTVLNTAKLFMATIMIGVIAAITGGIAYLLIRVIKNDINLSKCVDDETSIENISNQQEIIIKEEKFILLKFIPILLVIVMYVVFSVLRYSK
ncbi:MAG: CPBP family intramembrane metalloprotease [Maledivibacter sp.]|jgi:membrane protease YdiL (CAAX protease family)|nr:CPBP family intramembrane metalloprotease [Maledivibacter sp.]